MVAKILEHDYPSICSIKAKKKLNPLAEEVSDMIEFAEKLGRNYFSIIDAKLEKMRKYRSFEFGWQPAKRRKAYPT